MWLFDEDEDSIYIHFRVMDRDEISADDFLGEVKVPFKHIKLNRTLYLELSSTTKTKKKKEELLLTMPQLDSESLDRDKKPYLVIRLHVRGVRAQISLYHLLVTEITELTLIALERRYTVQRQTVRYHPRWIFKEVTSLNVLPCLFSVRPQRVRRTCPD